MTGVRLGALGCGNIELLNRVNRVLCLGHMVLVGNVCVSFSTEISSLV